MSNRVHVQRTRFTNLVLQKLPSGELCLEDDRESFGFRIYDDFDQAYCNTLNAKDLVCSDATFLKLIEESADDNMRDMISFALDHGIYIDDEWYDAEWVNKVLHPPETGTQLSDS